MAYEGSKSTRDNFGKFIYQFQPETKTLIRKLERTLYKLCKQNLSLSFNETCLNERLLHIYIYIYTHTHTHTHTREREHGCVCMMQATHENISPHLFVLFFPWFPFSEIYIKFHNV